MIATFVRNTCPHYYYRLGSRRGRAARLATIIISYNNSCKGPWSPKIKGDDVDEEDVFGVAAGCQRDACVGAGKNLRTEAVALGAGLAPAAEGARGLGRRGREAIRRQHQIQGLSGAATRQGVRSLRHGARRHR